MTSQTLFNAIWNASPILVTIVSFWHFAVVRHEELTPSIAFTSVRYPHLVMTLLIAFRSSVSIEVSLYGEKLTALSLLRDEIRSKRSSRNFHQHAPSKAFFRHSQTD